MHLKRLRVSKRRLIEANGYYNGSLIVWEITKKKEKRKSGRMRGQPKGDGVKSVN